MTRYLIFCTISFVIIFAGSIGAQIPLVNVRDSTFLKVVDIALDSINRFNIKEQSALSERDENNNQFVITATVRNLNETDTGEPAFDKTFGKVIEVKRRLSYVIGLTLWRTPDHFRHSTPTFMFNHKSRLILVYSGSEIFIKMPSKTTEALLRTIGKRTNGSYDRPTPIWWFKVSGSEVTYIKDK